MRADACGLHGAPDRYPGRMHPAEKRPVRVDKPKLPVRTELGTHATVTSSVPVQRFAALVRKERIRRGWSQRSLAEFCGTNHELIRRIEAGEADPRLSLVSRLLVSLDLTRSETILGVLVGPLGRRLPRSSTIPLDLEPRRGERHGKG
jgi:ribosome-binding protein aMBF1 (putative translation factor)